MKPAVKKINTWYYKLLEILHFLSATPAHRGPALHGDYVYEEQTLQPFAECPTHSAAKKYRTGGVHCTCALLYTKRKICVILIQETLSGKHKF